MTEEPFSFSLCVVLCVPVCAHVSNVLLNHFLSYFVRQGLELTDWLD